MAFVRARGGADAVAHVLARLGAEDRAALERAIAPDEWYPFQMNDRLDASIAHEFGIGNKVYRALGARSASDALASASYVEAQDPHALLRHLTEIHRQYKDSGHMTYERVDDSSAIVRTFDCASYSASDCLTNLGWIEKAIELCGGKNARAAESECRARGQRMCEYVCRWD
jgi:predicted hydrocarbon binding protein